MSCWPRPHGTAIDQPGAIGRKSSPRTTSSDSAISADGRLIRANQGHSVEVDLGLVPVEPPEPLFHGTVERFLDSIRAQGLVRGKRQHVHLSADRETAARVGQRRGRPSCWSSRPGGCTMTGTGFAGRRTAFG